MARKAKRIRRRVPNENLVYKHPTYFELLAVQLATNKQQSWFDVLPEEIKTMIWKEYYKTPLLQIREFGMYRGIIRIYMRKHIHRNYYDDVKYSRDGKHVVLRYATNAHHYHIVDKDNNTNINMDALFSSYDSASQERTYYKIFDEAIVPNIKVLYGLCKAVPEDWDYIGCAEDIVAGRYTYNPIRGPLAFI
ncbi:MAG: hypothetical protein ACXABD_03710 [Candidatus Thorarchaeota archaeon]